MIVIRSMGQEDLEKVCEIDVAAFGAWHKRFKGQSVELHPRRRANLLALLDKDPAGCFVAEAGGCPVGFIFSRTWNSEGWFGTFGVLPEYQGNAIGKRLIAASLGYLRGALSPQRVIGLETMAESAYNLGLYMHLGFKVRSLTFLMEKSIAEPLQTDLSSSLWSLADPETQKHWIADLQEVTDHLRPGLDYSKEILSTADHGLGETLVLTDGRKAIGMSTVWEVSQREGMGEDQASVQVMVLHPAYTTEETFSMLLDKTAVYARSHNKRKLAVPVNSSYRWVLQRLLDLNFRVELARVRMVLEGEDAGPSTDRLVNCARWLG
ncbi:MAG: N-acetyltransferase [Deltaproteobacteria bacterium]|nr:N-acetyltransferase [Deltaproteobacteria bacterium]